MAATKALYRIVLKQQKQINLLQRQVRSLRSHQSKHRRAPLSAAPVKGGGKLWFTRRLSGPFTRSETPLNQCCACREDFASLAAFDAQALSEPADPKFDCMQVLQLKRDGWIKDARGRWTSPELVAQAAKMASNFRKAAQPQVSAFAGFYLPVAQSGEVWA